MQEKTMSKHPSLELPWASGSDEPRFYEDYILNVSLEVALTMGFVGMLMQYGPPAWAAYGMAAAGAVVFLFRLFLLVMHRVDICKPPRWDIVPMILILAIYAFFFFIKDQFCLLWIDVGLAFVLVGVRWWRLG